jgi:hypothetical protein
MTYEEMMYVLKMHGFGAATLHCFALAHEAGATDEELEELYGDLMFE